MWFWPIWSNLAWPYWEGESFNLKSVPAAWFGCFLLKVTKLEIICFPFWHTHLLKERFVYLHKETYPNIPACWYTFSALNKLCPEVRLNYCIFQIPCAWSVFPISDIFWRWPYIGWPLLGCNSIFALPPSSKATWFFSTRHPAYFIGLGQFFLLQCPTSTFHRALLCNKCIFSEWKMCHHQTIFLGDTCISRKKVDAWK